MRRQKEKPELKVIFDTNVIYSGTAYYLLNEQVSEFIKNNSNFFDLLVSWYVPEIVIKERTFQMISKGNEFIQPIKKLEKLLGHNLNITEEIIITRVKETIDKQINEFDLKIIKVDIKNVNWDRLIHNSVFRLPPFENNSKEKGFRDSIIVETFDQLIKKSPKTSKSCRIAFVCDDNLLNEAAKLRAENSNNIRFVKDLNELKSLINILVSEIEESVINDIAQQATEIFFIPKNEGTFYYTENIRNQITEKYSDKISELPDETASQSKYGTWYISPVNFVKKERQKIFWRSAIEIDLISYKKEYKQENITRSILNPLANYPITQSAMTEQKSFLPNYGLLGLGNPFHSEQEKTLEEVEYLKGKSKYEVIWSVTYRTNKKLFTPKIEEINFIGNIWNDKE